MAERAIEANGVELCTEAFGDPADPPVLLVMGTGASMLWWEDDFCRLLASRGRYVIRYDHRDTGRSVHYEPGRPRYTGADMTADALGVLDAHGLDAAHLVGASAGGGIAQEIAIHDPDRALSLVLISTTSALPSTRELPPPTEAFNRFAAGAEVDWDDDESIVEYLTGYQRVLAGGRRPFDEQATRDLVRRDVERARDPAAVQNHDILPEGDGPEGSLSQIAAPTLVVHGSADPMFPPAHGEALAEDIPGARLLILEDAGHGIFRPDWETLASAIAEHTGGGSAD
jgi:pimeloyl-ACP methyl ester carboxylesterase